MRKKILIIEDDSYYIDLYKKRFANADTTLLFATDGITGLETAYLERPNLIILELILPKMDGVTVLNKLRKDDWGGTIPVIIITFLQDTEDVLSEIKRFQPASFFVKSKMDTANLWEKIESLVTTKQA